MEVSGWLCALAALPTGKEPLVPSNMKIPHRIQIMIYSSIFKKCSFSCNRYMVYKVKFVIWWGKILLLHAEMSLRYCFLIQISRSLSPTFPNPLTPHWYCYYLCLIFFFGILFWVSSCSYAVSYPVLFQSNNIILFKQRFVCKITSFGHASNLFHPTPMW